MLLHALRYHPKKTFLIITLACGACLMGRLTSGPEPADPALMGAMALLMMTVFGAMVWAAHRMVKSLPEK